MEVQLHIKLNKELKDKLRILAGQQGLNMSTYIRNLLNDATLK